MPHQQVLLLETAITIFSSAITLISHAFHKATSLLERKLIQLYHFFIRIDPQDGATFLLLEVERSLLTLHTTNRERLPALQNDPVPPCNYLTTDAWHQHLRLNSVWEGIRSGVTVLAYIFGFQIALPDSDLNHNITDVVDAIHMGLIPIRLDTAVLHSINTLQQRFSTHSAPSTAGATATQLWDQIKDLIKARAIGIHRLITSENKTFRKLIITRYGIQCF